LKSVFPEPADPCPDTGNNGGKRLPFVAVEAPFPAYFQVSLAEECMEK
jgi:hypothetical protein